MRIPIRLAGSMVDALVIDASIVSCGKINAGVGAYLGNVEPYECSRSEPAGFVMSWEDFESAYLAIKAERAAYYARHAAPSSSDTTESK